MRVAARKFAVLLWISAAVIATHMCLSYVTLSGSFTQAPEYQREYLLETIVYIIMQAGTFVLLGAIIWILGDIRDRLAPPP